MRYSAIQHQTPRRGHERAPERDPGWGTPVSPHNMSYPRRQWLLQPPASDARGNQGPREMPANPVRHEAAREMRDLAPARHGLLPFLEAVKGHAPLAD